MLKLRVALICLLAVACNPVAPVVTQAPASPGLPTSTAPPASPPPTSTVPFTPTPPPTDTPFPTSTAQPSQAPAPGDAPEPIVPGNASRLRVVQKVDGLTGGFVILSPDWHLLAQVVSHPDQSGQQGVFLTIRDSSALLSGGSDMPLLAGETALGGQYAFFQGMLFLSQGYLATTVYCAPCAGETVKTMIWMQPGPFVEPQFANEPLQPIDIGGVPLEFITNGGTLRGLSASPDGWLVAISDHQGIKLFNLGSLETTSIAMPSSGVLAFSPNGQFLAIGAQDAQAGKVVKILDTLSGQVVNLLSGQETPLVSLAYSPVGSWLAAGGQDELLLWDTVSAPDTGSGLLYRKEVRGGSIGVVFSPDGRLLATTGNGAVVLWQPEDGSQLATLSIPGQPIHQALFSLDGNLLLTITSGSLQVWQVVP